MLLINDEKERWSIKLGVKHNEGKYGGFIITISDQFDPEPEQHLATIRAHRFDAQRLIAELIDKLG